jgi:disulfide bond formation protein DsbB
MFAIKSRQLFLAMFFTICGLIAFALYLQYYKNLAPCPLCMLQRVVFIAIALVCLIAAWHNPTIKGLRNYGIVSSVFCLIGIGLASRQLWLESLPPALVPPCGPSLEAMLRYLPLFDVLKATLIGSGECAKITWEFLGLTIAAWSFICFAGLLIASLNIVFKPVGKL